MNVYEACPVLRSQRLTLRLVEREDAAALLKVYSDERTVQLCNNDNCSYGAFRMERLEDVQRCIDAWLHEYGLGYFVRWAVVAEGEAIGTVELFHREAQDAFNHHGLMRIDLRSDYEHEAVLCELLELVHQSAYELFECAILATKVPPFAAERIRALTRCGYIRSANFLIGHDGTEYGDYWVRPE